MITIINIYAPHTGRVKKDYYYLFIFITIKNKLNKYMQHTNYIKIIFIPQTYKHKIPTNLHQKPSIILYLCIPIQLCMQSLQGHVSGFHV